MKRPRCRRGHPGPGPDRRRRARTRRARRRSRPASRSRRPRSGINQLCGSGLRAVAFGCQAIKAGDANIVVAGGQESMSQAPHCAHLRDGTKMGELKLVDTMIKDGLWDAFNGYHMGNTAENVAQQVPDHPRAAGRVRGRVAEQGRGGAEGAAGSRTRSSRSRSRPARATSSSTPTSIPRHGTTAETLGQAAPGLQQGRHGHRRQRLGHQRRRRGAGADERRRGASGAGSSRWRGSCRGRPPASTRRSWASARSRPRRRRSRRPAGRSTDLDLVEANEAFAAQACAVGKELGLGSRRRSTSMAAPSRSAIRSAPRARAC